MTGTEDDATEIEELEYRGFEERADHIAEDVIRTGTVTYDYFDKIQDTLLARGLVLLEGPRGSGKTHIMRHTWYRCRDDENLPLAVYVSFNRYLRLEPLLRTRADALNIFQAWMLARILLACEELSDALSDGEFSAAREVGVEIKLLQTLVGHLERAVPLSAVEEEIVADLTIDKVVDAVENMAEAYGRNRVILLLDDAALTLTPEYMFEFFDIVRVIKRPRVSPKASVYPGTTEYGPRFHADHEGRTVSSWLSVDHHDYLNIMDEIGHLRYPEGNKTAKEVRQLLIYAAFGVPRSYLAMLREWNEGKFASDQQAINVVVQNNAKSRMAEYRSLRIKVGRLASIVDVGDIFFTKVVDILRDANLRSFDRGKTKQTVLGVEARDLTNLQVRMINILVEAGLIFELPPVSHGDERLYRRLTPHYAALISARAFSGGSRGTSARQIVDYIKRPLEKHPVRRKLSTMLDESNRDLIKLDLPQCQRCGEARLSESQKFCHSCGTKLIDQSVFTACMDLSFQEVPGLSNWAIRQLEERKMSKLGDIVALQDPGTELRKIHMVGVKRAERIIAAVESYIDEFLS